MLFDKGKKKDEEKHEKNDLRGEHIKGYYHRMVYLCTKGIKELGIPCGIMRKERIFLVFLDITFTLYNGEFSFLAILARKVAMLLLGLLFLRRGVRWPDVAGRVGKTLETL